MNCCVNAGYVSLISRWLSAAMASNTSDDLPDPDTPVNTVIFRFGISSETFLRLFSRAPRISIEPYALSDFVITSLPQDPVQCRTGSRHFDRRSTHRPLHQRRDLHLIRRGQLH